MDCNEARMLIDERVHGSIEPDHEERLNEHLPGCPDCARDLKQLLKVRVLLGSVKDDAPPEGALDQIWKNVRRAAARSAPPGIEKEGSAEAMSAAALSLNQEPKTMRQERKAKSQGQLAKRRRRRFWLASSLSAAALLIVMYQVGIRFSKQGRGERMARTGGEYRYAAQRRADRPAEKKMSVPSYGTVYDARPADAAKARPPGKRSPAAKRALRARAAQSALGKNGRDGYRQNRIKNQPPKAPALLAPKVDRRFPARGNATFGRKSGFVNEKKEAGKFRDRYEPRPGGAPKAPQGAGEKPAPAARAQPKIIKNGELTVEVKNFTEASRKAGQQVAKFGGFIADRKTVNLPGGTTRTEIKVRIEPSKFEQLFAELKKLGTVLHERAGALDITAQYTDTEARIKNLQVAEVRLQELIRNKSFIDKIKSLLEVERELSRVRGEIERAQGRMRVWKDQLALSTIRLTLQEPSRAVPSGSLSVEVGSLHEAKKALDGALTKTGGHLLSGQTAKRGDGTLRGTYTLRVAFGRFAELTAAIKDLGRVEDEKIRNQPFDAQIPKGAEDVPCELSLVLFERSIRLPSASLSAEVQNMAKAVTDLKSALAAHQGTIVTNRTQRQPNGTTTANITLRVRAGRFEGLLGELKKIGRVTNLTVNGESGAIQGGAAEVPSTLSLYLFEQPKQVPSGTMTIEVGEFAAAREQLSALIEQQALQVQGSNSRQRRDGTWSGLFKLGIKADRMDQAVAAFEQLGRVKNRELKGLGLGDLSRVDPNVIGQVALVLEEKPAITPREEGSFRLMLRDTFGGFLTSMSYIIRGLGVVLPWLLIVGLFVLVMRRFLRKSEASPAASMEKSGPAEPEKPAPENETK